MAQPSPKPHAERFCEIGGAFDIGIDDRELACSLRQQRMRNGSACTAGTDQYDTFAPNIGQRRSKTLGKARAIGVVADAAAVA